MTADGEECAGHHTGRRTGLTALGLELWEQVLSLHE